jgi:ketosteroid isomerase-like protein
MYRWIAILLLGTVLGSSSMPISAAPSLASGVPEWATTFLSAWYYSFNRGDASGVAALFSENARLGETNGRAEIQKTLAAEFEKTQRRCHGDFDGFKVLGNLAVGWGHETCVETTRNAGKAAPTKERWLLVFEMAAPGQWLLTRETYQATN